MWRLRSFWLTVFFSLAVLLLLAAWLKSYKVADIFIRNAWDKTPQGWFARTDWTFTVVHGGVWVRRTRRLPGNAVTGEWLHDLSGTQPVSWSYTPYEARNIAAGGQGDTVWRRLGFGWDRYQEQPRAGASTNHQITLDELVFRVPYWPLLALMLLPLSWSAIRLTGSLRRRRRIACGHCPTCGYDLQATPGRCPECGWQAAVATEGEAK